MWPQVLRELMDCFEGADDSGSGWVALDGFEASLTRLREGCKSDDDFVSLIAACFQVPFPYGASGLCVKYLGPFRSRPSF